jgi:hypothetical protein
MYIHTYIQVRLWPVLSVRNFSLMILEVGGKVGLDYSYYNGVAKYKIDGCKQRKSRVGLQLL